ncbi:MAG: type 1 glutamine amidotransferase [Pseudomonadota bacterium]
MKPIWIFRHLACEGPGYLATFLDQHHVPHQLIAIDEGAAVPKTIDACRALVFMGGPMSVNDDLPWIAQELDLIRQAHAANLPVLGHCLGAQLIAKALGGTVRANEVKEIGWHEVRKADNPRAHAYLKNLPDTFLGFHWHGETFSLPEQATPLFSSRWCANQGFVTGNMLALQFHVEMTSEMVRQWAEVHAHELAMPSESVQGPEDLMRNLGRDVAQLQQTAAYLYKNWIHSML